MLPYIKEIRYFKTTTILISFLLLSSYAFYHFGDKEWVVKLGKEDSLFEWLTTLCYLSASIFLFATYRKQKSIFYLLLAAVLFFGAGEEISWGQRLVGFNTPETLTKVNVQGEFNIHNLELFNRKQLNGENTTGWRRLLEMDLLFKLFTIAFGFVLPVVTYHLKPIGRLVKKLRIPVPPASLGIFFLINWFFLKICTLHTPTDTDLTFEWRVFMAGPEISEAVASFVLLCIAYYFFQHRKKHIAGLDFKEQII